MVMTLGCRGAEGKSGPVLVFVVAAQIEPGQDAEIGAAAVGVDVVGDVGDVVGEVVDAAAVEDLGVGGEAPAGEEDARADFKGGLADGGILGRGDATEVEFASPMGAHGEVGVGGLADEADGGEVIAGMGEDEAASELQVAGTAYGGH